MRFLAEVNWLQLWHFEFSLHHDEKRTMLTNELVPL